MNAQSINKAKKSNLFHQLTRFFSTLSIKIFYTEFHLFKKITIRHIGHIRDSCSQIFTLSNKKSKMDIQISAIICTFNRSTYLKKAIQSLIEQTLPKDRYEIIVVDNGSTDDTKMIVKSFEQLANLRYTYEQVTGLSQSRNTGWQSAQGKYIAFLDDDAIAYPEWLERIVEAFETVQPRPGSVGGKVIPIWEVNRPAWLPRELERSLTIIDWTDKPTFLNEDYHYLAGTNVAYTREILQECGGFSTLLGRKGSHLLSGEEILMKRYLKRRNLRSYYDPNICVQHHVPAERLLKRWFYRRVFWQGITTEILQYLEADQNGVELCYLFRAISNTIHLFRNPKNLALIFMQSNSSNGVVRKCDVYGHLGQICAQMQIGFGLVGDRQMWLQKVYHEMLNFALAFHDLSFRALREIRKEISNISILFSLTTLFITNRRVYRAIKRVIKDKLTYLEVSALIDLYKDINDLKRKKSDGIIIETGCGLGGSALVMAVSKEQSRLFYIYDVFGMIPPPSELDGDDAHERYKIVISGKSKGCEGNRYYGYEKNLLDKVEETFCDYGIPPSKNNVHLIKGLFEDTLFVNKPVALAHIDCDWYESVMTCLQRIEPHLVKGGILIIDDYYTWLGCRKAVDEYFSDKKGEFKFIKKSRLHIIHK